MEALGQTLAEIWREHAALSLNVSGVAAGTSAYISAEIERSEELSMFHKQVIECAADARTALRAQANESSESNNDRYGNDYVLDKFQPHFSVAKVDYEDRSDALSIVKGIVKPGTAKIAAFQLVDIAPDNSKWDVIWSS